MNSLDDGQIAMGAPGSPIRMAQEMPCREKTTWSGTYDGIDWEVQRFKAFPDRKQYAFTFYLYLWIGRIPEENDPISFWLEPKRDDRLSDRVGYDYLSHGILSSIDWHGGITWYSKESGIDGSLRVIKVGCDFQHYFDEEYNYCPEDVKLEVITAIDSFRKLVPGYKYWCHWNGKLHDASEIVKKENGQYKCNCGAVTAP